MLSLTYNYNKTEVNYFVKPHTNNSYIATSHHIDKWVTFKLKEPSLGKHMPEEFKIGSHTPKPFKHFHGHFNYFYKCHYEKNHTKYFRKLF